VKSATFKKGMLILREAFPDRFAEIDKASMQVWFQLLYDIPDKDFETTVLFIARNHEKPPLPATIRKVAMNGALGGISAEEAWHHVMLALRSCGMTQPPKFNDSIIQKALSAIGWQELCATAPGNLNSIRAHFYRTYNAMRKSANVKQELKAIEESKAQGQLLVE
jgi:hypothetical protein